jgi:dienelactone hydrolase
MTDTNRPIPGALLDAVIKPFPRLTFPSEADTFSMLSNLQNRVFRPATGAGPFPAIVLVPTCGGTTNRPEIRDRTKEFLDAGYLVLVLENYVPRGQKNCRNQVVTGALIWRDVVDALTHLHTMTEVDKSRIYQVGYSAGAAAAAAVSSRAINAYFDTPLRFKAAVGWYGSCAIQTGPAARTSYLLRGDMEHPVLLLMSEADKETPPRPYCFPLLDELKAAGKPIEWHLYQSATHSWDTPGGYILDNNGWGERVVNSFDAATTADATRRTLEFLERNK